MFGMNGKLGFGFMRIPALGDGFDTKQISAMVDTFLENGFNYFDTAHGYCGGKSELVLRECLVDRYPREKFLVADKLSAGFFEKHEDIIPFFKSQLKAVGVDWFDCYLMHAQNRENYEKYKACKAYETAVELKKSGLIKHVGFSFHDNAETLDKILTENPQVEFVQLQFNYLDFNSPDVQSRKCYEVCVKHGKPVIVMEPVKGGKLAQVPPAAKQILDSVGAASPASFAIRFAAGFDNIAMVLSGMSSIDMMNENVSFMKEFKPLSDKERAAIGEIVEILNSANAIPCTGCSYCTEKCPKNIPIPQLFDCLNKNTKFVPIEGRGSAADCIGCGTCESVCPQHLEIRKLLKRAAKAFA